MKRRHNDAHHGRGILRFMDGGVYVGEFKNHLMEGIGRFEYPGGEIYEGGMMNGMRHGRGKLIFSDQSGFEGLFVEDWYKNTGKFIYSNGEFYEGTMIEGNRQGLGKHCFVNGDIFHGIFKDDEPIIVSHSSETPCCYVFASGDIYTGQFQDMKPHGKGLLKYSDGNIYEGEFINGIIAKSVHGHKRNTTSLVVENEVSISNKEKLITYTTGDRYEGQYINGKAHGFGKMTYRYGNSIDVYIVYIS